MSSPDSRPSPCSPASTPHTTALDLQTACTKLFRVVLSSFRKDRIDINIVSRIHRSSGSLVLWARDYGLACGSVNGKLSLMPRLRTRILKSLQGTCEVLLHRLIPLVEDSDHPDLHEAKESAARALSSLDCIENDETGDESSIISVHSTAPDLLEEACSDLEHEIECLMAMSPMIDVDEESESRRNSKLLKSQEAEPSTGTSSKDDAISQEIYLATSSKGQGLGVSQKRPMESDEAPPKTQAPNKVERQDTDATSLDSELSSLSLTIPHGTNMDISKHLLSGWHYYFPRGKSDIEVSEMMHDMSLRLLNQKLTLAPIAAGIQSILDLGTGTGLWAIDVADEHPSAMVLGWDVSTIQLPSFVPPNLCWEIQDFESEWDDEGVEKVPFDFINASEIILAVRDYDELFKRTLEYLKPGGWFELKFFDYTVESDHGEVETNSPLVRVWHELEQALGLHGVDTKMATKGRVGDLLRSHGFNNIQEAEYKVPLGSWAKDEQLKYIGLEAQMIFYDNLCSLLSAPLLNTPSWPDEAAINRFIVSVQDEVKTKGLYKSKLHIYYRVVCGQKPVPNSSNPSPSP